MPANVVEGSLVAIPTVDGAALAKVIFASNYFADTIALKLFCGTCFDPAKAEHDAATKPFKVYYTGGSAIRSKRWKVVGQADVTREERLLTKRTSGGEIWLEDEHLGSASESELAELPKMLVYGHKLIEKYAAQEIGVERTVP